jgi:hypothetical protein
MPDPRRLIKVQPYEFAGVSAGGSADASWLRPLGDTYRPGMNRKRAAVMLAVLVALAGCGLRPSSNDSPPDNKADGPTATAGPTGGNKPTGASATLKLTGFYTYDGPVTGNFSCDHNTKGRFELEAQDPYLIDIRGHGIHDGTFTVVAQYPKPGQPSSYPDGQPNFDVYRLDKSDDSDHPTFLQTGGTITFTEGGNSGTLEVDYADRADDTHKVHVVLKWKSCPLGTLGSG